MTMKFSIWITVLAAFAVAAAESPSRPKLQFINGGAQMVDIFWLKSAATESNKPHLTSPPAK